MSLNEPTWYEYVSREVFFVYSVSMHFKIIMNKLISWKVFPTLMSLSPTEVTMFQFGLQSLTGFNLKLWPSKSWQYM